MNPKRLILKSPVKEITEKVLFYDFSRRLVFYIIEKSLKNILLNRDREKFPRKLQQDKFCMARTMMYAIDRGLRSGQISRQVWTPFVNSFGNVYLKNLDKIKTFQEKYGFKPPGFVTISPTKNCNLQCIGCYANSFRTSRERLDFEIVTR
ncbi:MAG: hypothetical protein DRG25_06695, partial [Deltaproteobacteria bacterium]